jgi:hypothetical protein
MVQNMLSTTALVTALHESDKPELRDDLFIDSMELVVQTETALLKKYRKLDELLKKKVFQMPTRPSYPARVVQPIDL